MIWVVCSMVWKFI